MCLSLASQEVSGTKQQAKGRRQCVTLKHSEPTEGSDAACIKTDRTYSIGMLSEAYAARLLFQKGKILQYCIVILVKTIFSLKKKKIKCHASACGILAISKDTLLNTLQDTDLCLLFNCLWWAFGFCLLN